MWRQRAIPEDAGQPGIGENSYCGVNKLAIFGFCSYNEVKEVFHQDMFVMNIMVRMGVGSWLRKVLLNHFL
jgi:hypothetical protein